VLVTQPGGEGLGGEHDGGAAGVEAGLFVAEGEVGRGRAGADAEGFFDEGEGCLLGLLVLFLEFGYRRLKSGLGANGRGVKWENRGAGREGEA